MQSEIRAQIKSSLLAGDRFRCDTLKMALTALQYAQIAKGSELQDAESVVVLQKEIKKRKEAADMYRGAGARDRADKEETEIGILTQFVPEMLNGEELKKAVEEKLAGLESASLTFPLAMKTCIETLGNVDKAELAAILKSKLV